MPVTQQQQQGYQTSSGYTSSYKPLLASTQQYDKRYTTLSRPLQ